MSGAVKSGLIFAFVGIISLIAFTILPAMISPLLGICICGPLAVVLNGSGAGYVGVRWSKGSAGVGQGVLAGAIAGIGLLIGAVLLFVVLLMIVRSVAQNDPDLYAQVIENALRQQPEANIDPAELDQAMNILLPVAGFCFGLLALAFSVAFGALGGWIATRRRAGQEGPPSPPPQPFGPPPLSPTS
jgi:hypothetical protein